MLKVKQSSTWCGLALLGSVIAMTTGHGELFSAGVTDSGLQLGGVIGAAVPAVVGLYHALRDEFKGQ